MSAPEPITLPLANLSAIALGAMSPAAILRYDLEDRETIAAARAAIVQHAGEAIEELTLRLQSAEERYRLALGALETADNIASPGEDKLHDRRVGDVLTQLANDEEYVVLGIREHAGTPQYLVTPLRNADAREGDGARPEWRYAVHFRRP